MTVLEHIGIAKNQLVNAGLPPDTAAIDAEVLARHVLGWDTTKYLSDRKNVAPSVFSSQYSTVLERRTRREPVALIIGRREFWGMEFEVNPSVLTPRPETELLVEETLNLLVDRDTQRFHLVDIGAGSGCLSVALASELPTIQITATDISHEALTVAHRNAIRHGVDDRINWLQTTYLDGLSGRPNVIVSNPPYISDAEIASLPPEVRNFEPRIAIISGPDGLDAIRALLEITAHRMVPGGHLVMEFGMGQLNKIRDAVRGYRQLEVQNIRSDLQGIPRVIVIKRGAVSIEVS